MIEKKCFYHAAIINLFLLVFENGDFAFLYMSLKTKTKFGNCEPEAKKLEKKGEKSYFDKLVLYHSVASRERRWIWVKTFFDPTGYDDMNLASSIFMMKKDKSLPWQHGASC